MLLRRKCLETLNISNQKVRLSIAFWLQMSHGYKPIPVLPDERQRSALSDDLEYWLRMKV